MHIYIASKKERKKERKNERKKKRKKIERKKEKERKNEKKKERKKQNGICVQRRLRSAWASAQSDQSFRCPHEESLGPYLPIERTSKTMIRLGGCPG